MDDKFTDEIAMSDAFENVSPSQLEEVTLDPDATNFSYLGLRSPGALTTGRTVKEIDEQLSSLKKENFNLKLRLYFLEERMGSNFNMDKEDVVQKNIELQVELANLQKELDGKQELLCQAAKAMEIEEDEHEKEISAKNQEICNLKEMIEQMRFQVEKHEIDDGDHRELCPNTFDLSIHDIASSKHLKKLQNRINGLENELKCEQERSNQLDNIAEDAQVKWKNLELQVAEKESKLLITSTELESTNHRLNESIKQMDVLAEELQKKSFIIDSLMTSTAQKELELKDVKLQFKEIKNMYDNLIDEKRNNELAVYVESLRTRVSNLEFQLENSKDESQQGVNNDSFAMRNEGRLSPSSPTKSDKLYVGNLLRSHENNCNGSSKEINESGVLSQEEVLELKKNHFKACKILKTMIQKKKEYVDQIEKLETSVKERTDEINFLKRKMSNTSKLEFEPNKKSIKDKVSELNLTAGWHPSSTKESLLAEDAAMDLTKKYKELAGELEKKIEILHATLQEKDAQIERLKLEVQQKGDRIIDLEFELLAHIEGINEQESNDEKQDMSKEKLLEEKDELIQKLESELRKRTGDLQGIVNKELWEKNRTIEKLQTIIKGKEEAMCKIEKTNSNTELQLKILKQRINELGIHVNIPSELVSPDEIDQHKEVDLGKDYQRLRAELEKSEKMRRDSQEICCILNNRLEELCHFLQSLLKHKSILGFLGQQQSHRLHEAVNKSLEFSHALSNSILVDADQSLQQLCNITNLLNSTRNDSIAFNSFTFDDDNSVLSIIPSDITLTFHSHLTSNNNEGDVVIILRDQISNLKREVELRDVELERLRSDSILKSEVSNVRNLNLHGEKLLLSNATTTTATMKILDNQSESESWSEPDRNVSFARIGLQEESLKSVNNISSKCRFGGEGDVSIEGKKSYTKSPPKRSTLAENRHTIISLQEQISELEAKLKQKEEQLSAIQLSYNERDQLLKQEQDKSQKLMGENSELSHSLNEISKHYENSQNDVEKLKVELAQLALKIQETNIELEKSKLEKLQVEEQLSELQIIIASLEEFKRNVHLTYDTKTKHMQNTLNEMEIEKTKAIQMTKDLEVKFLQTIKHLEQTESELHRMCNRELEVQRELERSKQSYTNKLNTVEFDLQQQAIELKTLREKECASKKELEQNEETLTKLSHHLEQLRVINKEGGLKILHLEEKIDQLLKQLDDVTLKNSELVLEKTRLKNQTITLETKLSKFNEKEIAYTKKLNEADTNYRIRICNLEHKNLSLESQLSDLIKVHNPKYTFSLSLPNDLNLENTVYGGYKRQISDQSDNILEQIQLDNDHNQLRNLLNTHNTLELIDDSDRMKASASPDLGIESDQGRFSSLENNAHIPRPLLPSLEIAQTMNNLLNPAENNACKNQSCHKQMEQITNENVDLRKRLLKTRHALDDTVIRLKLANKQKQEVEKSICKQIHKTSQVLRKAKANLDSGSET
ncbi:hypothetical protein RI129_005247 [Pyrocoelia pectoralis]|uniref:Centrosomin N-terminal motif 1 domain-containing protein n=1 Tax=Pyrocoelia pectoralis TaxID=417401 RepID=A0AAN7VJF5_9COLE